MSNHSFKEIAIHAEAIEVGFLIQREGISSLKQYLLSFGRSKLFEYKKVLDGIDLTVYKGECFGLLGRNGSGKSTLLRTLAGIISPDKGKVTLQGRVAPLLSLGVGLEPELSGFENIRLCGALIGLTAAEIQEKMQDIISFSELSNNDLQMQIRRYSSGMTSRLAFSIAVATDPDILIVDEALAVGDAGFQQKCLAKINQIRNAGATIFFVSHNAEEVNRICDRAAWLVDGKIIRIGNTSDITQEYLTQFN
jgi:ABC-type polysaccharide/polyol phosphate transport system ATPase subunit